MALLLLWATPSRAAPTNDECMTCHAVPDIAGRRGSVHVRSSELLGSVHGRLSCVSCHSAASAIPHAERLPAVRCQGCHGRAASELRSGAHAAVAGGGEAACRDCHGTHGVRSAAKVEVERCASCHSSVALRYARSAHGIGRAQGDTAAAGCADCHGSTHRALSPTDPRTHATREGLAQMCARCHADRALMDQRRIALPAAAALYQQSVHGRSDNPNAATCKDCHDSHGMLPATDPASSVHRSNVPATCGRCHARQQEEYRISVHGIALARGVSRTPVCTDCHGEHLIRGPNDPQSPVATSSVTTTCAHCHEAPGIRETYGLPAGRLSSYQDSFHGLAARGGSPVAANCASCHGAHMVLPSSHPGSMVHPANLPATCGKCHPGAGERFASGRVHVAMATPDQPVLYAVRLVYLWLIGLTIGGMVLHNALDFGSKLRRKWQEHMGIAAASAGRTHAVAGHVTAFGEAARWYERMTPSERVQHVLLAVSFLTLVYTGFALKFPESWLFSWLARLEGGYAWRSLIHRGAAVVLVAAAVFHVVYLLTRRGRRMLAAMVPRPQDAGHLVENVLYMLGRRGHPPRFEHFGYIEKAEYWALLWGTLVMTLTGVVLWFENQSLQVLDKWVLDLATLVHYYEAWLAFLAIVVWHFYMTIVNPDVYPMSWVWITGRIGEDQMRHEHAAEWERIQAEEVPAGDEPAAGARLEGAEPPAAAPPAPTSPPLGGPLSPEAPPAASGDPPPERS